LQPWWLALIYIPLVIITLVALFFVSCRDPGLLERVTDEEAGHGGWFWNEQVGSFRPAGAMYCRECKVRNAPYSFSSIRHYLFLPFPLVLMKKMLQIYRY